LSLNCYARKVRDRRLDLRIRRCALNSCILRLAWLTRQRYLLTRDRFAARFSLDPPEELTEDQLLDALTAIEVERNRVLEKVRAFDRKRLRAKLRGRRQMSAAEAVAFREALAGGLAAGSHEEGPVGQ
jgi:hypothetical protein